MASLNWSVESSNLFVMLVDGTTAFNAAHTTLSEATDSGADEVSGSGWPSGGAALSGGSVASYNTSYMKLDANNVYVTASGGAISAQAAILYVDVGGLGATKYPLSYIDFGGTITAQDGQPFQVYWPNDGIIRSVAPGE